VPSLVNHQRSMRRSVPWRLEEFMGSNEFCQMNYDNKRRFADQQVWPSNDLVILTAVIVPLLSLSSDLACSYIQSIGFMCVPHK